ncbi:unnamed protein product [Diabrotica balteata]|uniref:Uncharacterized protein n=1 Tax=Diabrotica balteata TaxID=107213 RepID=A0A9N9XB94_DIABA|nr:unnamed protein product [Diabrotica balteata]
MIYKIYFCMLLHFVYEVDPAVVDPPKLPSYFKICSQSAPNLGKCIKKSVEELKPLLIKGIPDLDIPSVEPLHIPEVVIDQGSGPVALKSVYKDIKVYGPSKFIIKDIKVDLEKDKMRIRLFIPRLKVVCNYNMEGKIMMMPISGSGKSSSNYSEAMNMFLNDNWKQIANEIKPVLEDNIAMIFKKFANKIFHKYPKNVLLPK